MRKRERLAPKFVRENGHMLIDAEMREIGKACELRDRMSYRKNLL